MSGTDNIQNNFAGLWKLPEFKRALKVMVRLLLLHIATITAIPNFVLADSLPQFDRVRVLNPGREISDPELVDQYGESFRLSELRGQVVLIFFGFTNCPDVCPLTMAKYKQLQDSGSVDSEKIVFVLISVDSERDTPAVLKKFLGQFSDQFIGLTGDPDTIRNFAKGFSAAFYKSNPTGDGGYLVSHSRQSFVVDSSGRLRAEFYGPTIKAMAGVANALIDEANEGSTARSH